MKLLSTLLLAAVSHPLLTPAAPYRLPALGGTSPVTVIVSDLPSTTSAVKLYFYNVRDKFLKPHQFVFRKVVKPAGQKQISLPVELEHGDWAVAITQDLNNNDKLDKNMVGIPAEPYAFSNNIRPKFSAPNFDECKFAVSGPGQVINIVLKKGL